MYGRLLVGVMLAGLAVAGCAQQSGGQAEPGTSVSSSGPSRTLGTPNGDASTSDRTTTTLSATPTGPTSPAPTPADPSLNTRSTVTNGGTITEYTTIFSTEEETPAEDGPATVIGSPELGPNASGFVQFQSPSGNIMCAIYDEGDIAAVRCDITSWTYPTPAAPGDCDTNFNGGTAEVGADGTGSVGACVGDTVADLTSPVLRYGDDARLGRFGCHSAENGVTCANLVNGHGFRIARSSYDIF